MTGTAQDRSFWAQAASKESALIVSAWLARVDTEPVTWDELRKLAGEFFDDAMARITAEVDKAAETAANTMAQAFNGTVTQAPAPAPQPAPANGDNPATRPDAGGYMLPSGKHAGKSVAQAVAEDKGWATFISNISDAKGWTKDAQGPLKLYLALTGQG
jgi:hypothetical protein